VELYVYADGEEIEEGVILSISRSASPFQATLDVHFSLFGPDAPDLEMEARSGGDVCWIPIEFPW